MAKAGFESADVAAHDRMSVPGRMHLAGPASWPGAPTELRVLFECRTQNPFVVTSKGTGCCMLTDFVEGQADTTSGLGASTNATNVNLLFYRRVDMALHARATDSAILGASIRYFGNRDDCLSSVTSANTARNI
mmetsp:Transcript_64004/g.96520  ORF Transcript_64004/g.96520 Transcript_64004/m.96520 type:complete len:134 (-) Transcript_64004:263-664(-)